MVMKFSRILNVIFALCLFLGAAGYYFWQRGRETLPPPADNGSTVTPSVQPYRNGSYGYGIMVPASWRQSEPVPEFPGRTVFQAPDGSTFEITVTEGSFISPEQFLLDSDRISRTAYEGQPAKRILNSEATVAGGLKTVRRDEEWLAAGLTVKAAYIVRDSLVYTIVALPAADRTQAAESETGKYFSDILSGVTFTDISPP